MQWDNVYLGTHTCPNLKLIKSLRAIMRSGYYMLKLSLKKKGKKKNPK